MIISGHARDAMQQDGITEDEVRDCLEHGAPGAREAIGGEMRYSKRLDLKGRAIEIVYTLRTSEARIITVYGIRRKKQWREEN